MQKPTERLPQVAAFLSQGPLKAFIGGKAVASSNGQTFDVFDPGSGEKLTEVFAMQPDEVASAVSAAQTAFDQTDWATMSTSERSTILRRLADAVEQKKEVLAQLDALDCGKLWGSAVSGVDDFVTSLRYYADLAEQAVLHAPIDIKGYEASVVRRPWGVCGVIVPWNYPFVLCGWGIAPALAAGNTVVVKPAEDTSLSTLYFATLVQAAGVPDGVINIVPGIGEVTGAALAADPRLKRLSFTGSSEVGRQIAEVCGRNLVPVKLELGGKGAALVFDDVDIEKTADKLVCGITGHTGQVCCASTRWFIQKPIYEALLDACIERLKKVRIGYQLDETTDMGPVVSKTQQTRVLGYLEKALQSGATALVEGGIPDVPGYQGTYVKPALLTGPLDNIAAREEIFGPVAYVASFESEAQGIQMVNDTPYGLGNSVWSSDLDRARRVAEQLEAGNSWINDCALITHGIPYGGIKQSGMGGGVLSMETLLEYWRPLSVVRAVKEAE